MNICFLMYPWERVNPEDDSTLRIIHEAVLRGHRVMITTPANLTMRNSTASAFCKIMMKMDKVPSTSQSLYKKAKFKEQMLPLAGFDAIFMRANPPIDSLMLNFLDSVKNDVFILNDIEGLREANNKLYTATFHDPDNEFIPVTHVSKNKEFLKKTIRESKDDKMILKPLDGMQGRGVIIIEKDAAHSINSLLDFYISGQGNTDKSNYVILQEYIEGADKGDVRVLMLNGEPIGAMRRVPQAGEARSNIHAGGSAVKHTLTKQEKLLCKRIGPKLVSDGLFFVGLDLINNKLIEVNVCSPGGIAQINKLYKTKVQTKVIDFIEQVIKTKNAAITRKDAFRKAVEGA